MNEKGIQRFLQKAAIGKNVSITADHSYHGSITRITDKEVTVDEGGLIFTIPFSRVTWHSLECQ